MSNKACLYAGRTPLLENTADPMLSIPGDEPLFIAGAAYAIPAFWLFCFAADDFVTVTTADGEYDTFVTEVATARGRLAARDELARERFPTHTDAWALWKRVIDGVDRRHLKLDVVEIWATDKDPSALTAQLSNAIDWFDGGTEADFAELLRLAGVRHYDSTSRAFQAAPGVSPEACLYGWFEPDARRLARTDPGAAPESTA